MLDPSCSQLCLPVDCMPAVAVVRVVQQHFALLLRPWMACESASRWCVSSMLLRAMEWPVWMMRAWYVRLAVGQLEARVWEVYLGACSLPRWSTSPACALELLPTHISIL